MSLIFGSMSFFSIEIVYTYILLASKLLFWKSNCIKMCGFPISRQYHRHKKQNHSFVRKKGYSSHTRHSIKHTGGDIYMHTCDFGLKSREFRFVKSVRIGKNRVIWANVHLKVCVCSIFEIEHMSYLYEILTLSAAQPKIFSLSFLVIMA